MTEVKAIHRFTYLGFAIKSEAMIDKVIDNKLPMASCAI